MSVQLESRLSHAMQYDINYCHLSLQHQTKHCKRTILNGKHD